MVKVRAIANQGLGLGGVWLKLGLARSLGFLALYTHPFALSGTVKMFRNKLKHPLSKGKWSTCV